MLRPLHQPKQSLTVLRHLGDRQVLHADANLGAVFQNVGIHLLDRCPGVRAKQRVDDFGLHRGVLARRSRPDTAQRALDLLTGDFTTALLLEEVALAGIGHELLRIAGCVERQVLPADVQEIEVGLEAVADLGVITGLVVALVWPGEHLAIERAHPALLNVGDVNLVGGQLLDAVALLQLLVIGCVGIVGGREFEHQIRLVAEITFRLHLRAALDQLAGDLAVLILDIDVFPVVAQASGNQVVNRSTVVVFGDPERRYRAGILREIPANVRFLSCEPLIADLGVSAGAKIDRITPRQRGDAAE